MRCNEEILIQILRYLGCEIYLAWVQKKVDGIGLKIASNTINVAFYYYSNLDPHHHPENEAPLPLHIFNTNQILILMTPSPPPQYTYIYMYLPVSLPYT